jgi:hypothetical protein
VGNYRGTLSFRIRYLHSLLRAMVLFWKKKVATYGCFFFVLFMLNHILMLS